MASFSKERNFALNLVNKGEVAQLFHDYLRDRYVPPQERLAPKVKKDPVREAIAACDWHDAGRYGLRFNGLPALALGFVSKIKHFLP